MAKVMSFDDPTSRLERDECMTVRRDLERVTLDKYQLEANQVHSTYEVFVVGELSELQVALVIVIAAASYTTLACTALTQSALLSVVLTLLSFIPAVLLLIELRLKCGISTSTSVWLGNATIITHAACLATIFVFISTDRLHFGGRAVDTELFLCSMIMVVSLGVLPCTLRCHTPLASAMSWIISEASCILAAIISEESSLVWYVLPALMLAMGVQLYSFERCNLSAYNHLVGLEGAVRLSLDSENQKKVLKMQSNEMRSLIGNVAHDLKTPMQAFSLELNGLSSVVADFMSFLENRSLATAAEMGHTKRFIEDTVQGIHTLQDTVHFMLMTINRSIDFTKASAGISLSASNATVDIIDAMQWVQHLMHDSQSRIPITFKPPSDLICTHVITDKLWLIENMLCLVSNAVKFTDEGGHVVVSCRLDMSKLRKPLLRFEVEDTGIGIAKHVRLNLFKPFAQAQRCVGGTGLGLYSLRKRMEALGGDCGLDDRHDGARGCLFWFRIPYVPDIEAAEDNNCSAVAKAGLQVGMPTGGKRQYFRALSKPGMVESASNKTVPPARVQGWTGRDTLQPLGHAQPLLQSQSQGITIMQTIGVASCTESNEESGTLAESKESSPSVATVLLVEDSIVIQKSTTRALTRRNATVDLANNGSVGLNMMLKNKYDLVLMDLQMPVMDGIESVRRLRAHEKELESNGDDDSPRRRQLIVGISANSDLDTKQEALNVGMDDFLGKPVSIDALRVICSRYGVVLL